MVTNEVNSRLQGRVEGSLVAGICSAAIITVYRLFMLRRLREKEREVQDLMFDRIDDIIAMQDRQNAILNEIAGKKVAAHHLRLLPP